MARSKSFLCLAAFLAFPFFLPPLPAGSLLGTAEPYPVRHRGLTASGEPYAASASTAAFEGAPLGSYLRVTHLQSGRQVIVRVNDRLPEGCSSLILLSKAASRELEWEPAAESSREVLVTALTGDELAALAGEIAVPPTPAPVPPRLSPPPPRVEVTPVPPPVAQAEPAPVPQPPRSLLPVRGTPPPARDAPPPSPPVAPSKPAPGVQAPPKPFLLALNRPHPGTLPQAGDRDPSPAEPQSSPPSRPEPQRSPKPAPPPQQVKLDPKPQPPAPALAESLPVPPPRAPKPATAVQAAPPPPKAQPLSHGYVVRFGTHLREEDAWADRSELARAGVTARVLPFPGSFRAEYRVLSHPFASEREAQRCLTQVKKTSNRFRDATISLIPGTP